MREKIRIAAGIFLAIIGLLIEGLSITLIPIGFLGLDRVNPEVVYFRMTIFFSIAVALVIVSLILFQTKRSIKYPIIIIQWIATAVYLFSILGIYWWYLSEDGATTNWTWITLAIVLTSSQISILSGIIFWPRTVQLNDKTAPKSNNPKGKFIVWFLILLSLILLIYLCVSGSKPPKPKDYQQITLHTGLELPPGEIVFEIEDNKYGFINADGKNFQEYIIDYEPWSETLDLDKKLYIRNLTWDPTGNFLVGYYYIPGAGPGTGDVGNNHPIIITQEGEIIGCQFNKSLSIGEQVWVFDESKLLITEESDVNEKKVVIFDFTECEIIEILHPVAEDSIESIYEIAYSSEGFLAFLDFPYGLKVFSPQGSEIFAVADANDPAWSKDGNWLAFKKKRSIYKIKNDGTEETLVAPLDTDKYFMGQLEWSPDDQWIIFVIGSTREEELIKVNVQTGEITDLYIRGKNPSWR